jgi:diguanylate cyclase (GGDEF)-like protein
MPKSLRAVRLLVIITMAYLVFIAVFHLAIAFLVKDENARIIIGDVTYPLWNLAAAAGLWVAARRSAAQSKRLFWAWAILALAQISFTLGDVSWAILEVGFKLEPFPSFADGFYLLYYPLFLIGIFLLPSERLKRMDRYKSLLDISIVMIAATLGIWSLVLRPLVASGAGDPLLSQVISLAYPVGDLVLLTALLKLIHRNSRGGSRAPLFLLAAGILLQIVSDIVFARESLAGTYTSGSFLDVGWALSYALIGMAGFWQAATLSGEETLAPPARSPQELNSWQTYLPYLGIAGVYLLYIINHPYGSPQDFMVMAGGVGVVTGLVLVRQILTMIENGRLVDQLHAALSRIEQQSTALQQVNRDLLAEVEERKRAEVKLAYDSLHDALTGLPNRVLFMDRLKHTLEHTKRYNERGFSVVFLDVDHFKLVNDSLSHRVGDQLLIAIAQRLRVCLRMSDTVARLGGDEFVFLLEEIADLEAAISTVNRIQDKIKEPFSLDGHAIQITGSFGIVLYQDEYTTADEILQDADIAMYRAKAQGKARYEVFNPFMRNQTISHLELKNDLQSALERQELFLNYQPIYALDSYQLLGFEALLRWRHPQKGLIPPLEFIPIAEETGLINPIGQWVLQEACRKLHEWQQHYQRNPVLTISVNVSGSQFKHPDFAHQVTEALRTTGLKADSLIIEITEGIFLDSSPRILATFEKLNAAGVKFQIDDFGTGYSSLSYLQDFPIQAIKVDRSFVQKVEAGNSPEIIRTIIIMAHDLGMETIAEGIETESQLKYLMKLDCNAGQGYLLGLPTDEAGVETLLHRSTYDVKTRPTRLTSLRWIQGS